MHRSPRNVARVLRCGTTCLFLTLASGAASEAIGAEPTAASQVAKARDIFRSGVQLEAANDWAGALAKFEAVAAVKMTPQVRFHIARCQHKLGKLLEALGGYRLAAHEASKSKDSKSAEVLREANAGITEIESRIPKVVIVRGKGVETATVYLDDVPIGETSIGSEMPVNPGGHTVSFADPDGKPKRLVVTLAEGEKRKVDLVFEGSGASPRSSDPTGASTPGAEPMKPPTNTKSTSRVWPWVFVGVGGASLAASGVFYFLRRNAINDLDANCNDNVCPTSMQSTGDKGRTYSALSAATLGIGVAAVGVGAVMLLTGSKGGASNTPSDKHASHPQVTFLVGGSGNSAEAGLAGTF